ncbi:MAG TPA: chromosome segregation protein SMC [Gammaproteobacteria bacterium]|nr:chromosome segregation protein SMC [Gammaproteobacteria bacterium]
MRLSKTKLSGFKTFVDPTTIKFPSNLMGVVGPNGCGKSNIIDAIRWVLGEASAKTLRGDSMADVIFNGSVNRKPVGVASVELTFDNSDGTIAGAYAGYSEISVRRVVSRDGTSQYYLNNARCRRKDITHILLGTGVGSHGYSIIEQGMISRLVEAKPEELRAFIEEAAGISKYKERRHETELRIQHTRENLERLADLREELDKQITHLQKQAKDAEKYKAAKAEQRRVNAELLALRLTALRTEVAGHEHLFKEKQLALDAALADQQSTETQIEKLRVELADRNESFNAVQGNYYKIGAEIARLEQSVQHRKELLQRQNEDLHGTDQQIAELQSHVASDQVELEQLDQVLSELGPGLEQAYAVQRSSQQELEEAERAMEDLRARWEQSAEELASAARAIEVESTRLEQLTAQGQRLEKEQQKHAEERATLTFDELEQRLTTLVGAEERLVAGCDDATRALDTVWQQIQQLRDQDQKVSAHLDQLREQLQTNRGRLTSLEALQQAALGKTSEQVNRWIASQELGDRSRLAQELTVERGWERAVETVLGPYLQALTIQSIDRVAASLPELTEGGLTLLEHADGAAVSGDRGHLLLAHVSSPAAVAPLLTGIRVADSLADATALRPTLRDGESVVTREGVWMGRNWVRINRSDDPQVGVIARGDEIKRLNDNIRETAQRADEVAKALADTRSQVERLEEARVVAQAEAGRRQQLLTETRTNLGACRSELEQSRSRAAVLDRAIADLAAEQRTLIMALDESRSRRASAVERQAALATAREDFERQRREQQERVTGARAKAEEHREAAQAIAIKVESRRSSKESASSALARVQSQLAHLTKRQRELQAQIDSGAEPLAAEESQLVGKLDQRLGVEADLALARAATEEIDTQLRDAEQLRHAKQDVVDEIRGAADNARLAVREAQVRAETVSEQFAETGFELEKVIAELPPDANVQVWHDTFEQLERRIQRLGAINLAAIDEFQEQSERKKYLDSQFVDLTEALEVLENAIRKIDRETRTRFKETFDNANQGLGRLFPRLFGGGHAYLELEGEDLLASGVTVMARPPGKKNSSIHLLSGGEKALTAVALVFAIFELNPAPFCLLDEVDAPLDDANVGRFSQIVKEMSERVQFVIITHNKTTMETMHQLTGVTMHEPGVSRMVAVDIDEAVKLAAM